MLSNRALAANSNSLRDLWRFTADDVLVHARPIFRTRTAFSWRPTSP